MEHTHAPNPEQERREALAQIREALSIFKGEGQPYAAMLAAQLELAMKVLSAEQLTDPNFTLTLQLFNPAGAIDVVNVQAVASIVRKHAEPTFKRLLLDEDQLRSGTAQITLIASTLRKSEAADTPIATRVNRPEFQQDDPEFARRIQLGLLKSLENQTDMGTILETLRLLDDDEGDPARQEVADRLESTPSREQQIFREIKEAINELDFARVLDRVASLSPLYRESVRADVLWHMTHKFMTHSHSMSEAELAAKIRQLAQLTITYMPKPEPGEKTTQGQEIVFADIWPLVEQLSVARSKEAALSIVEQLPENTGFRRQFQYWVSNVNWNRRKLALLMNKIGVPQRKIW